MPRKPKNTSPHIPVESVKHRDKRTNIPTTELRDFVADDEKAPRTILYPRDPSLDPLIEALLGGVAIELDSGPWRPWIFRHSARPLGMLPVPSIS